MTYTETTAKYRVRYQKWLYADLDPLFHEELRQLEEKKIEDRFYKYLEFGTGGMRGVIGAGTNRMNKYLIRRATQGLAAFIINEGLEAIRRGVVVAYDSRHYSREFAKEAALVLAKNEIKAYLLPDAGVFFRYSRAECFFRDCHYGKP
jgi:phosphoglucomutase